MNIFEKIRNCIADKMNKHNVPDSIANKVALDYVVKMSDTEINEIAEGRMKLEYDNLTIKQVNIGKSSANRACLLSLTNKFSL